MRAIASYIMRGRMQAILVVTVCAVLSLLISPFSLVASGAAGLVTLRKGSSEGAIVAFGGLGIGALIGHFATGSPALALAFVASVAATLVPTWILAGVLRSTVSLGWALSAALGFGAVAVVAFYLTVGDPALWWAALFEDALAVMQESDPTASGVPQMLDVAKSMANWLTGMMAMALALSAVLSLFLARGWQAILYNPGGFKEEFYAVRLSKTVAGATLLIVVGAAALGESVVARLLTDVTWVALGIYGVVGLAVVHSVVAAKNWPPAVMIVVYVLLLIPHVVAAVAFVGWIDAWVDLRSRAGGGSKAS